MANVPKRADLYDAMTLEPARTGAFPGNAPDPALAADVVAHVGRYCAPGTDRCAR